jgi:hypothetical protein
MVEIERLKPESFHELATFPDGFLPDPARSVVVVARDGKELVGRSCIIGLAHVEGTFIKENWRRGNLLKKILDAVEVEAKKEGLTKLFAYSETDEVGSYLQRLGYTRSLLVVWEKGI